MRKLIRQTAAVAMAAMLLMTGCGARTASDTNDTTTNKTEAATTKADGSNKTQGSNDSENESDNSKETTTAASGANDEKTVESAAEPLEVDFALTAADMFTDRDYRVTYDEKDSVLIELTGDSAKCSSKDVEVKGSTITIKNKGTYIVTGTLNDGKIVVDAEDSDKPQIVLKNASITSSNSAPIYVIEADKVFITLAEGSSNVLTNGGTFDETDEYGADAVIFSKQDLTLNGAGNLTINSPAGHGITSKDDLVITSGTYTINAASHGLDANDSVRIAEAKLIIDAGKDGIHSENSDDAALGFVYVLSGTFDIDADGDGVSAGAYTQIEGGDFDIKTGGGSANATQKTSDMFGGGMGGGRGGMMRPGQQQWQQSSGATTTEDTVSTKAIKSVNSLLVSGGTFKIDSADDAVHSNIDVVINGGTFEITTGDDGFHADETLTVTNGKINITKSYEGLEGLNIVVDGGDITIVASDDGINAAGGNDESGFGGMTGGFGGRGGMGGGMSSGNGSIIINGGTIYMNASGDGIDANGTLTITGGMVTVCGPTSGDTAVLDYDKSAVITGGTFIGTGAQMMAQSFSDAEQGVIALSVGNQSKGTNITIKDSKGNTLLSYEPKLAFQIVVISMPELVSGETYTVSIGSQSGEFQAS